MALFSVACLAVSGCGHVVHNPPKDENGNLPDDVVRNFIELVKADNYEAARKLWYGDPKRISGPISRERGKIGYIDCGVNHINFSIIIRDPETD